MLRFLLVCRRLWCLYVRKRRGRSTEPRGTQLVTLTQSEYLPVIPILSSIHQPISSSMKNYFSYPNASSFAANIEWDNLSNAWTKSKYIASTALPSSNFSQISSTKSNMFVEHHDRLFRNPCWLCFIGFCNSASDLKKSCWMVFKNLTQHASQTQWSIVSWLTTACLLQQRIN